MSRKRIPAIARLAHRRALLETLIGYLKDSGSVSNQDIRSAVTKNEYGAYRAELRSMQPSLRKVRGGGIDGVTRYLELLGKADRLHGRAENVSRPGLMVGLKFFRHPSLHQRVEHLYECALEALDELVSMSPGVAAFFDRPVTFTLDRYPSLDPESMPRLHTSRSPFTLHVESGKQSSIFRLKLETLQASLTALYGGAGEPAAQHPGKRGTRQRPTAPRR